MTEHNSFRSAVVDEIIMTPIEDTDSAFALISAIAKNAGVITINKKRINLVMSVDTYAVAMYLVDTLKSIYRWFICLGMALFPIAAKWIKRYFPKRYFNPC